MPTLTPRLLPAIPQAARALRFAAVGLAIGLAVAGCGRRGNLEPPPGAVDAEPDLVNGEDPAPPAGGMAPIDRPAAPATPASAAMGTTQPGVLPSLKPNPKQKPSPAPKPPKADFFLDPIL